MPLLVGLGNIGEQYSGTRHNVGFDVIMRLARTLEISMKAGKGSYYFGNGLYEGKKVALMMPTTYMNRSGSAVQHALAYYKFPLSEMLVITDDLNLPTGKIRLKPSGSAGGHNGISDIIYQLKTDAFARLRFGIGKDYHPGDQANYVLSRFRKDEEDLVTNGITQAHDAALCFVREGIDRAMNLFN